ncbi:MAG: type IX secretion system membrane protein PorP/SprF [Saprospiraceae bacterium]|nr:type IX secretion system membrane protein PorP/SprF [Candidatus Vicinibacter affinis]
MGTQYQFSTVFAGLWYRHARQNADAMIGVIGFRKDSWKLAYSFDYTLSKLGIGLGGSHEISILFNKMPEKRKKKNIQDCFEAFN